MSEIARGHAERVGVQIVQGIALGSFSGRIVTFATLGASNFAGMEQMAGYFFAQKIGAMQAPMYVLGNTLYSNLVSKPKTAGGGDGMILLPNPAMPSREYRAGMIGEFPAFSTQSFPTVSGNINQQTLGVFGAFENAAITFWKGLQISIDDITNLSKIRVMSMMWHQTKILRSNAFSMVKVTALA